MIHKHELQDLLSQDPFKILQINPSFDIDINQLNNNFHLLQKKFHPDNWVNHEFLPLIVMASAHINTCYTKLKDPLQRALLLLDLNEFSINFAQDTTLSENFLSEQMEYHELIDEANKDINKLEMINHDLHDKEQQLIKQLSNAFKQQQFNQAKELSKQLAFYNKLLDLVENTISMTL